MSKKLLTYIEKRVEKIRLDFKRKKDCKLSLIHIIGQLRELEQMSADIIGVRKSTDIRAEINFLISDIETKNMRDFLNE